MEEEERYVANNTVEPTKPIQPGHEPLLSAFSTCLEEEHCQERCRNRRLPRIQSRLCKSDDGGMARQLKSVHLPR